MDWENEVDSNNSQRFNRKRKKRPLLAKQRHNAKRGRFGRGCDIGADTFNYLLRVMEVKLCDFQSPEDKEIFIDNVFEQTAGREVEISCNQLGSKAMEMFLPWANDKILLRFTYAFSKDMRKVCCDEFGSHVIQKLIVVVSALLQKTPPEGEKQDDTESQSSTPDMVIRFSNWLLHVCKFVLNNVEEFVWDKFANHIVRTVLECLSGLPPGSTSKEKKWEKMDQPTTSGIKTCPIEEGTSLIQECGNNILQMHIGDLVYSDLASGLLQTLLATVHKVDSKLTRKILRHLLDLFDPETEDFSEEKNKKNKITSVRIPEIFMSQAATRLMDMMLSVSSSKLFTQIYTRCFINKLKPLSVAQDANFCVQNLIKNCTETPEFETIFDELSSNFEALLQNKRYGVLVALGQSCQRLNSRQGPFIKELHTALHCVESDRQGLFPLLVACMVDYETWCKSEKDEESSLKAPVTIQGSLIIQTMLNFPETMKIIKALLNTDCEHLKLLLCNPFGCHIAEAFFSSKTVGGKSREKMFRKLQGSYVALAVSKYGSRVLDCVWAWASLNCKKLILEELAPSEAMVNGFQWGSIFTLKSGLSLFKRRPKDWEECQKHDTRKQKLFADIIGP